MRITELSLFNFQSSSHSSNSAFIQATYFSYANLGTTISKETQYLNKTRNEAGVLILEEESPRL